jgi:hypothetical protein
MLIPVRCKRSLGGAGACMNASSKPNAEALRDLLDLSESRLQVVPTCVRFSLSQAPRELWRFDLNSSSSQIVESCYTRAKSILEEM